jgi:hypothetical protein
MLFEAGRASLQARRSLARKQQTKCMHDQACNGQTHRRHRQDLCEQALWRSQARARRRTRCCSPDERCVLRLCTAAAGRSAKAQSQSWLDRWRACDRTHAAQVPPTSTATRARAAPAERARRLRACPSQLRGTRRLAAPRPREPDSPSRRPLRFAAPCPFSAPTGSKRPSPTL